MNKFKGNSYVRDAVVNGGSPMGAGGTVGFVGRAFGGIAARNGAKLTVAPEDLSGIFDRDGSDPGGNTYLIRDREDMEALSGYLSSGKNAEGITFKVTNDIDLGGSAHTPGLSALRNGLSWG